MCERIKKAMENFTPFGIGRNEVINRQLREYTKSDPVDPDQKKIDERLVAFCTPTALYRIKRIVAESVKGGMPPPKWWG
jgi:hypothetical protein